MKKSEQTADLFKAVAQAQVELKNPTKNKIVEVPTKNGGKYSYKYADLANIIDETKPVLQKHGLAIIQGSQPSDTGIIIETILTHESGQWISSELKIGYSSQGRMNSAQEMGSAITYGRRYALASMLNISADEDDDANHPSNARPAPAKPATAPKQYQNGGLVISDKQVQLVQILLEKSGIDKEVVYKKYNVTSSKQLTMAQASEIIDKLNVFIAKKEARNAELTKPAEPAPATVNELTEDEILNAMEGGE